MKTSRIPNLFGLYQWAYSNADKSVAFVANVIQCQCGNKAKKMRGLYKLTKAGVEVRPWQFDLFAIAVDGKRQPIEYLETV